MTEYIEREAVCKNCNNRNICEKDSKCPVIRTPAADVAPVVHGRWVSKDSRYPFSWRYCSECGYHVTASMARNYKGCPICMARMDGENVDGGLAGRPETV